MGIKYEIEHYGAVEITESMITEELGLNGLSSEKVVIHIEEDKLHICLHELTNETNIAFAKLVQLALRYSDAVVITQRSC